MRSTIKKRVIIIVCAVLVLVGGTLVFFLIEPPTETPKTTQDWLNDFESAVELKDERENVSIEKKIEIWEGQTKIAEYIQRYEIESIDGQIRAFLRVEERYFTLATTEFDILDEYYLIDNVIYLRRLTDEEEVISQFSASLEIFWELVYENFDKSDYSFLEENFENLAITHYDFSHDFSASVPDANKITFFGTNVEVSNISNIGIAITIDYDLNLKSFILNYDTNTDDGVKKTKSSILCTPIDSIELNDWLLALINNA